MPYRDMAGASRASFDGALTAMEGMKGSDLDDQISETRLQDCCVCMTCMKYLDVHTYIYIYIYISCIYISRPVLQRWRNCSLSSAWVGTSRLARRKVWTCTSYTSIYANMYIYIYIYIVL